MILFGAGMIVGGICSPIVIVVVMCVAAVRAYSRHEGAE